MLGPKQATKLAAKELGTAAAEEAKELTQGAAGARLEGAGTGEKGAAAPGPRSTTRRTQRFS